MYIYILALSLILMFIALIKPEKNNQRRNLFIFVSFLIIIIISCLRKYTVGTDLKLYYYNGFNKIAKNYLYEKRKSPYELGFFYFLVIIGKITSNPQIFIAIHSIIVFGIVAWFIKKNSQDAAISVVLFITLQLWFMYMNILRQAMAMSIVLIASEVLKRDDWHIKKYVIYSLLVYFASLFHNSALIMIVLIPISIMKFKKKNILISIAILIIISFLYEKVFVFVASFFTHRDYIKVYLENSLSDSGFLTIYTIVSYGIIFFFGYFILIFKNKSQIENDRYLIKEDNQFSNDFLVYISLFVFATRLLCTKVTIIGRITYYFYPYILIYIPRVMSVMTSYKNRKYVRMFLYCFFIMTFIIIGYQKAEILYGTVPYEFFWD